MVLCTIGTLQGLTSYLGFRYRRIRPYLQGEPIVLVENGKIIERNMSRERLTLDDLAEKARRNEIASIDDIRWAVLETNGDISFIQRPAARSPAAEDSVRFAGSAPGRSRQEMPSDGCWNAGPSKGELL
jgi:uncharacterized membrane protein YcaP (DUF421 family)